MAIPTEWTKRYYSIGEASKIFDVKTSTLRFWEQKFNQLKPKKNDKGVRKYTPKDMEVLRQIYHLVKERGFTLDGAVKKLNHNAEDVAQNEEVVRRLMSIKEEMQSLKDRIDQI